MSSIAQEKARHPRLGRGRPLDEFKNIVDGLNLPYPKFIDHAVRENRQCGVCPSRLPHELEQQYGEMSDSPQG